MRPKTIIRRNEEDKIISVEKIGEFLETYWTPIVGLLMAAALWCSAEIAFMVGYEHGRSDFLKMLNAHQVEHGMPTLSYQRLYREARFFTDADD